MATGKPNKPLGSVVPPVEDWLARQAAEDILEPDLPIVDPHHHLWDRAKHRYLLDELLADTGDDAQASEAVEATLTGPEIEIAFNPTYLLDGLGAVGTPFSRISFTQASRPAVLTGQAEEDGEADTSYRYVLMPVRFAS